MYILQATKILCYKTFIRTFMWIFDKKQRLHTYNSFGFGINFFYTVEAENYKKFLCILIKSSESYLGTIVIYSTSCLKGISTQLSSPDLPTSVLLYGPVPLTFIAATVIE